jgi:hypothetical protein
MAKDTAGAARAAKAPPAERPPEEIAHAASNGDIRPGVRSGSGAEGSSAARPANPDLRVRPERPAGSERAPDKGD